MTGSFLSRQSDFILCVGGLAFALLACMAVSRWRLRSVGRLLATRDLVWGGMAAFATLAVLQRWGRMLWQAFQGVPLQPGVWALPLALEAAGAAWTAWALWRYRQTRCPNSRSVGVSALAAAVTALLSGGESLLQATQPSAGFGPLALLVEALGTVVAVVFAIALWLHCSGVQARPDEGRSVLRQSLMLVVALILMMGFGWLLTETTARQAHLEAQERVLELVSTAASAVRPAAEPVFGASTSQSQTSRAQVGEMLQGVASVWRTPTAFTLIQQREQGWVILLRSGSDSVEGGVHGLDRGTVDCLVRDGRVILQVSPEGPGTWITGIAVVRRPPAGPLGLLRADVDTTPWGQERLRQRLAPLLVTLLLSAALVLFDTARRRNFAARQILEQLSVEQSILLNTIETQIWYLKDPETYGAVNDAHAAFLGRARAHLEDRPLYDLMPEADAATLIAGNRKAFELRQQVHSEERVANAAGQVRTLSIVRTPRLSARHDVEYVVCSAEDVTEHRRTEELERQRAREMLTLLDSLPGYAFLKDANSVYVTANEKFCRALGLEREGIAGLSDADLFPPEAARLYLTADQRVLSGRESAIEVEEEGLRDDGRSAIVSTRKVPLKDEGGRVVGLIGLGLDITERKAAEAALRKAKEELEQSNRQLESAIARASEMALKADAANAAKSQFLANMSHEIRTPMNGIIGMINLLLDTPLTAEQNWHAEIVRSSAESLLCLINEVLDFSKIEAGRLELEEVEFELRAILEDTVDSLAVRAFVKGLDFACVVDPRIPERLVGDPVRLRQVVTNLADNAIKFTERGDILVTVDLQDAEAGACRLRFAVTDTGVGIPADRIEVLFTPFTQADGSVTRRFGGTGLGLSICRRLVDLMGGDIGVTSHHGKGTTFSFVAPFGRACGDGTERDVAQAEAAQALAGRRVLVVEDHPATCKVLSGMLDRWECAHVEAGDASNGLHAMRTACADGEAFDAVLLDDTLPDLSTRDVIRQVREDAALAATPLILLTSLGSRSASDLREARTRQVTKPPREKQLRQELLLLLDCLPACDVVPTPEVTRGAEQKPCRGRILVAEDNRTNQAVALGILDKLGYEAEAVSNGAEVLKALQVVSFDLVLMDCQMPQMDGYEATRRLRGGGSAIPIVAMTAQAFEDDRGRCLEAGMDDYLSKPLRPRQLSDVLDRMLGPGPRPTSDVVSPPPPDSTASFDPQALLARLVDDRQLADVISRGFLDDIPCQVALLEQALDQADAEAARRIAHTIKGAAANVGSATLRDAAREVEAQAEGNRLSEARRAVERMREVFAVVRRVMTEWLDHEGRLEVVP